MQYVQYPYQRLRYSCNSCGLQQKTVATPGTRYQADTWVTTCIPSICGRSEVKRFSAADATLFAQ